MTMQGRDSEAEEGGETSCPFATPTTLESGEMVCDL
jgi:hypothetical protein